MLNYNLKNNNTGKVTEGQVKKNIVQMTKEEIKYLQKQIRKMNLNDIKMTKHAMRKMVGINLIDVKTILKDKYEIIDYNYNTIDDSNRVLVRSKDWYNVEDENGTIQTVYVKLVIDYDNIKVVTAWVNLVNDEKRKNDNINLKRYDANLQIIK